MPPPTGSDAVAQPTEEVGETKPDIVEKFKMLLEPPVNDSKKFNRIRSHVQKLNEEFFATLYETEKRHKKEIEGYKAAMAAQEKNHQEEFYKVEQQYKAGQKKEISELYSELKAVERSHRETYSNSEMRHKSEVRTLRGKIDANEKFYQDALQKAENKLRSQSKKHEEFKKRAEEKIKTLIQKLLGKHGDMEAFQSRALNELDTVVEALGCSKGQVAHLVSALEKLKTKYSEEHEKRKADQKKIVSLRKMIEQYDGTDETTFDDEISEVKSDGSAFDQSAETPAEYYHNNIATDGEEFEKLRLELEKLRDSLKAKLSFGNNTVEHAELVAGIEDIMKEGDEDEEVQSVESSEEKEEEQKEQVSWKTKSNHLTVDTADTVDTLDDQVNSFINELSASRTKKLGSREESHSEIESRDACEGVTRNDSFEQMKKSSIVQQRLAMFNNGVPAQTTPKGSNVETGGNPKNVMQMWKDKTDQATPKQGNGALPKTFAFNDVKPEGPTAVSSSPRKLIKKTTSSSSISSGSSGSGRRVTIPKKIVLKIEAGEKLSAEEREILEGIQKFNAVQTPTAKSLSMSAE